MSTTQSQSQQQQQQKKPIDVFTAIGRLIILSPFNKAAYAYHISLFIAIIMLIVRLLFKGYVQQIAICVMIIVAVQLIWIWIKLVFLLLPSMYMYEGEQRQSFKSLYILWIMETIIIAVTIYLVICFRLYISLNIMWKTIVAIALFVFTIAFFLLFAVIGDIVDRIRKILDKYIIIRSIYKLCCSCKDKSKNQENIEQKIKNSIEESAREVMNRMLNVIDKYLKVVGHLYNLLNEVIITILVFIVNVHIGCILLIKLLFLLGQAIREIRNLSKIKIEIRDY